MSDERSTTGESRGGSGRPRPHAAIEFERMPDGSGVLVNGEAGAIYAVNATAAEVWMLCDGRRTEADIAAALGERYEAPPEEITSSVHLLLAYLRELGALERE